ncbi:MAG: hypothetical protein SF066_16455 [Thermoanaerobaculia bacterium]|nr:hypothetical protein [Thermoanaerobaculia bacterium]
MSQLSRRYRSALVATVLTAAAAAGPAWAGCNLPANVSLRPGDSYSQTGTVTNLPSANYIVNRLHSGAPLYNLTVRPPGQFTPPYFFVGSSSNIHVAFNVPTNAIPGTSATITLVVQNYNTNATACSDTMTVTILPPRCSAKAFWLNPNPTSPLDGSLISASWDGANCYVKPVPAADGMPFVYDNKYYLSLGKNFLCEAGYYDGANCYLGAAPAGTGGFVYNGSFYYAE